MWLFDNLFLDANTPITINDGIDHSKDVVEAVVDPTFEESKPGDMQTGSVGDDSTRGDKKDNSLVDLFKSDNKEEIEAALTLHPEPPKDIALEIWHSSPELSTNSSVSFDIGGDLSFDVGGNIVGWIEPSYPLWAVTESPSVLGNIEVTSTEALTPEPTSVPPTPQVWGITELQSWANPEKTAMESTSNNTLFALLNDIPPVWNGGVWQSNISNPNSDTSPPTSLEIVSSAFPSLMSETVPEGGILSQLEESHEPVMVGTGNWGTGNWGTRGTGVTDITGLVTHDVSSLSFTWDTDSHEYSHTGIGHLSSSSKLKSKLAEFLSELESMEFWDESQKAHKLQQIEMCRMRIAEIRREYDSRIHALQWEMQALEQEIREMDGEKSHIKTVIEAFQKELDIA